MLVIGLTGGIATGKSTVASLLKAKNLPIVDSDLIAREVVQPGTPVLNKIASYFGSSILLPDGTLDRKKLGSVIFNDEAKRKKLNSIIHPAIRKALVWNVIKHWFKGEKICIVDVPLLIEGGMYKWVGKIVVVYCSADIQLQRLMNRDSSSTEDASSRLNSQIPISDKVAYADHVIENSGSLADLQSQVDVFVTKANREAGSLWWRISWLVPPFAILSALSMLVLRAVRRSRKVKKTKAKL